MADVKNVDSPASPQDSEKGFQPTDVAARRTDNREDDFLTRNGLNLRSFQKRMSLPTCSLFLDFLIQSDPFVR